MLMKGEASKSKLVGHAMLGKYGESCRARGASRQESWTLVNAPIVNNTDCENPGPSIFCSRAYLASQ